MLSHGGSSDSIWTKGYKNVFGVLSPASTYFNHAIDWLKANYPNDKLAFLYAGDSFSIAASAAGSRYAVQQGLSVVYNQSYPTTAQDLSSQLTAASQVENADDLLGGGQDRKSTRLNSSHMSISYAVFCLKKKKELPLTLYNIFSSPVTSQLSHSPLSV